MEASPSSSLEESVASPSFTHIRTTLGYLVPRDSRCCSSGVTSFVWLVYLMDGVVILEGACVVYQISDSDDIERPKSTIEM